MWKFNFLCKNFYVANKLNTYRNVFKYNYVFSIIYYKAEIDYELHVSLSDKVNIASNKEISYLLIPI